jgi:hypothetical protein
MSGGRPKGAVSAFKNPVNIAALHMQALEAYWVIDRARGPDGRYSQRYLTAKVKRQLAERAIERAERLQSEGLAKWMQAVGVTLQGIPIMKRPTVEQVLRAHRRMGRAKLVRLRKSNGE